MYFMLTDEFDINYGHHCTDGLNIISASDQVLDLTEVGFEFVDDKDFIEYVKQINLPKYVRQVDLPRYQDNFRMIKCSNWFGVKYRSNMVILGERLDVSDISDYQKLNNLGISCDILLLISSINAQTEIIKSLISIGANVNYNKNEIIEKVFCEMNKYKFDKIPQKYFDTFELLIDFGANINEVYEWYDTRDCCYRHNTLLALSCDDSRYEFAKYLLDNGADPKTFYYIALNRAVYIGSPKVTKLLLDHIPTMNQSDYPVNDAIFFNYVDIVKMMLDHGLQLEESIINTIKKNGDLKMMELISNYNILYKN